MAKDHPLTVRLADEHTFALDVIAAAEGTTASGAVRWLIERYATAIQNPQLIEALPEDLHEQVPSMLSVGSSSAGFDPFRDEVWVDAHTRRYHGEDPDPHADDPDQEPQR